jgi:transmembrane sensor
MATRETSAEIEQAACAWAARLDRAALGMDEQQALDAWLAGDMRRLGAFARAQAMMVRLDSARALGPSYDPQAFLAQAPEDMAEEHAPQPAAPPIPHAPHRPTRRGLLAGGGAALAAAAAGGAFLLYRPPTLDFVSDAGKTRRIALADGSVIHLNAASSIEVRFTQDTRTVLLKAGEALFDVAREPARPFIVLVGQTSLRAFDTVFSVRRQMGSAVRVMVQRGTVELRRSLGKAPPLELHENMLAQVDDDMAVPLRVDRVDHADVDSGLSWLEGNLTFRGARLDDAADEFARYNGGEVLDIDPSLRGHRISGAFAANDPEGFARAVATSYGLRVTREGKTIHILPES